MSHLRGRRLFWGAKENGAGGVVDAVHISEVVHLDVCDEIPADDHKVLCDAGFDGTKDLGRFNLGVDNLQVHREPRKLFPPRETQR